MAYSLDFCDAPISCHAWNKDGTMVALCPNTSDLLIYKVNGKTTELLYTLKEHTQLISSCDWNPVDDSIVTCSHDRNAYVWKLSEDKKEWKKQLVLLKLDRAATFVRWSPDGTKFVCATGSKKLRVCSYDPNQNWWQSFTYDHKHPTSLTVDFMPDNLHIICSCSDRHMTYFTIDDKEAKDHMKKSGSKSKKIDFALQTYSCQGWCNATARSPDGEWIAFTSQDSYIRFVKTSEIEQDDAPVRQHNINGLPLLSLCFISNTALIGGGFDCAPRLFVLEGDDWTDLGLIDIPEIREKASGAASSGFASKAAAFGGKAVTKSEGIHNNIILGIRVTKDAFSTCANDGKLGIWPFSALKNHFKGKKLF
ncbi:actin-related protein 2/3 complex, subunit 1 [Histomonas meleagridis]|uniref:actin-related protein 2/3 complex, subunit 1 n=1 Tax=Histomonas meleagridis TaxID=135588 RepID=UPI00355973DF|nr:actin-related protein 2/3 complex, subunit 1 [Histomonas meleagridis]KAH0797403.1 actin-related protein 2/3 complex, subunit 1 [Histomonas meleagridis]